MDEPGSFDIFDQAVKNRVLHYKTVNATNAPYTALRFEACHVDCSAAIRTVLLPASPLQGWQVGVYDVTESSATFNITVDRNGKNIDGVASNYTVDVDGGKVVFEYDGTDWFVLWEGGSDIMGGAGRTGEFTFTLDGSGSAVSTGIKNPIRAPWDCTLTGWKMVALDSSGAAVSTTTTIDVLKDTYANWSPTTADTITNGHEPAIAAATKAEDTDISDWSSVTVTEGDYIMPEVDANDNAVVIVFSLTFERA
jgi:hypothetical protein